MRQTTGLANIPVIDTPTIIQDNTNSTIDVIEQLQTKTANDQQIMHVIDAGKYNN